MKEIIKRTLSFQKEAHSILSIHESARSRTVILDGTYAKLKGLSIKQDELLRQSLRCTENILFRAAHILAWVALIDFIQEKLASDGFVKVNLARPRWNITSLDMFREEINEFQIIEVCKDVGLIKNPQMRILHGFLSKRNECAHPTNFYPDYNQTLGYTADILSQIETLQKTTY
jgi:hypothetical protein